MAQVSKNPNRCFATSSNGVVKAGKAEQKLKALWKQPRATRQGPPLSGEVDSHLDPSPCDNKWLL